MLVQLIHKKLYLVYHFAEDNFTTGSGAGSFKVDSAVVGLKVFRNELIIFCEDRIYIN